MEEKTSTAADIELVPGKPDTFVNSVGNRRGVNYEETIAKIHKGRGKGTPNRFSGELLAKVQHTFNALETWDAERIKAFIKKRPYCQLAWAMKNPSEFWAMTKALLPKNVQLTGPDGGPIQQEVSHAHTVVYLPDNGRDTIIDITPVRAEIEDKR